MANKKDTSASVETVAEVESEVIEEVEAIAQVNPIAAKPERVELSIPRGSANDEPNVLIGFNGVNYLLPRGKTSLVPPEVKAEYERSQRAQERMDERIDEMLEAAQTSI